MSHVVAAPETLTAAASIWRISVRCPLRGHADECAHTRTRQVNVGFFMQTHAHYLKNDDRDAPSEPAGKSNATPTAARRNAAACSAPRRHVAECASLLLCTGQTDKKDPRDLTRKGRDGQGVIPHLFAMISCSANDLVASHASTSPQDRRGFDFASAGGTSPARS